MVLLSGYLSVKLKVLSDEMIDGLMKFAVQIAIPCLLFRATSTIDLSSAYDWKVLLSYFGAAILCFSITCIVTWKLFSRRPGQAVAVSFGALFSNLVLIGFPIVERALGEDLFYIAVALVSVNAPICYFVGITAMEMVRADSRSVQETTRVVITTMFKNSLMIGIALGFMVNLSEINLPEFLVAAIDTLKSAALPAALFGLGGILTRYSFTKELNEAASIATISLLLHPILAYMICTLLGVDTLIRNTVVLLAAMPPGLNAFLFADMYSRGKGTAANTVLLSTILAVFSVSTWLWILLGVS
jgi:predicted permease